MWSVRVPSSVETEEVLEEDDSWLVKFGMKDRIRSGIAEELPELIEYPKVEMDGVCRKVFRLFVVAECLHAVRVARTQLEHGQDVRRAECEGVRGLVEDRIERDRILAIEAGLSGPGLF